MKKSTRRTSSEWTDKVQMKAIKAIKATETPIKSFINPPMIKE